MPIGAVISTLGGLAGVALQGSYAKRADERNFENWKMQQRYNSPAMQSARLRTAGIAPYQAAGQIAGGATAAAVPDTNVPNVGSIVQQASESTSNAILASSRLGIDQQLADSQSQLQSAQAETERAKAFLTNCQAIGQQWTNQFNKDTEDSQKSGVLWQNKAIEYGARREIRQWVNDGLFSVRERQADLDSTLADIKLKASQEREKMVLASSVVLDMMLKREFGFAIGAENLVALRLSNVAQRHSNSRMAYLNEMLPREVNLRLGSMARSNYMSSLEIDRFEKMYGEQWYKTYLSGLLSQEQENMWWNSYYSYSNSFSADDKIFSGWFGRDSNPYSPQGSYRLGVKGKQAAQFMQRSIGNTQYLNTAVNAVSSAAAFMSPKPFFMNMGNGQQSMFIQRGFNIEFGF